MPRDTRLKKVLFACDELSGFVHACGLVRPTGLDGLEPKSVRKKLKQPSFAAGVHRDEVYAGAELLEPGARRAHRERRRGDAADRGRARPQIRCRRRLGVALEEFEDAAPRVLGVGWRTPRACGRRSCAARRGRSRARAPLRRRQALHRKPLSPRRESRDRRRLVVRGSVHSSRRRAARVPVCRRCPAPGRP